MAEKYLPYEQDGKTYNLYEMPQGFKFLKTVDLSRKNLEELPDLSGCICLAGFNCSGNPLTNLRGAPKEVLGDFDANCCRLESTKGISEKIGGTLNLSLNNLQKIDIFPQKVATDVLLDRNPLTDLTGLAAADIGKRIYVDDELLKKYNLRNPDECIKLDALRRSPVFQAEIRTAGIPIDKPLKPKALDSVKRQEKWHRFKMSCIADNCPKVEGNELFEVIRKAGKISCDSHTPVYTDFGRGFAIPADTKFYDACFMVLEQTDNENPASRLQEAEHIRQTLPDIKFGKDVSIRLAFYMHRIIGQNPEQAQNFSEAALADAYPILLRMETPENRTALPIVEHELQERFPEKMQELQQTNSGLSASRGRNE